MSRKRTAGESFQSTIGGVPKLIVVDRQFFGNVSMDVLDTHLLEATRAALDQVSPFAHRLAQ